MKIILPFPPVDVSPNARLHWSRVAKAKKQYRSDCYYDAKSQGVRPKVGIVDKFLIHLVFYPPDKRRRDWDNMLASMKSGLDGLADALKVDDSKWQISFNVAEPFKGGKVEVTI
jgi:crossover junction endodeoxyribonuclease RusA